VPGLAPAPAAMTAPWSLAQPVVSEAALDRRIDMLRSQLGITTAQFPSWTAFAHAVRETALNGDALSAQRAAAVATMSAVDNMHDYARIVRAYADNIDMLTAAFDRLYLSLSATQRRTADAVLRQKTAVTGKPGR
jgi:LTXXQ motif family protein